ncbi:MAG: spore maturation protein A [Oscillospiraceae bacterium]|jgi:spore maturation protein A|nr:spore maturation protein A [Oscillospiraceae bacterium]
MMNYIWIALIVFSFISAIFTNNMQALSSSVISAGMDAVNLCVKLLGMLCLWNGLMNVAEKSGLTAKVGRLLSPILKLIFRDSKNNPAIINAISMNVTANLLGLGNAATPLGIEAMRRMQQENGHKDTASNDMVKFVVLNTAALHLVPTTVAVIRQSHNASNPMDIMPASWVTSAVALLVGITLAQLLQSQSNRKQSGVKGSRAKQRTKTVQKPSHAVRRLQEK